MGRPSGRRRYLGVHARAAAVTRCVGGRLAILAPHSYFLAEGLARRGLGGGSPAAGCPKLPAPRHSLGEEVATGRWQCLNAQDRDGPGESSA